MPFPGDFDKDFLAKSITGTKIGEKLRQVSADVVKIFPWDSRTCDLAVTSIAPRVTENKIFVSSLPRFCYCSCKNGASCSNLESAALFSVV